MLSPVNNLNDLVWLRASQQNRLKLNQAMNRLATGQRINSGADHPAGLIAAESMSATLAVLDAETAANERAVQMSSTADAALGEISGLLKQAKALAVANADATLSAEETQANQLEINAIMASVDRISSSTQFNGTKLLDGSMTLSASGAKHKIDSSSTSNLGQVTVDGNNYTLSDLRSGKGLDTTGENVEGAADAIDAAINQVSTTRAKLGGFSGHTLQSRISQVAIEKQHLLNTVSLIRDTDYAAESTAKIRAELLDRAATGTFKQSQKALGGILDILG